MALFLEGASRRMRGLRTLAGWHAWHAGVIAKSRDTPRLADLLPPDDDEGDPQTPAEMWLIAQRWNAAVNGRIEARADG